MRGTARPMPRKNTRTFDVQTFLDSSGVSEKSRGIPAQGRCLRPRRPFRQRHVHSARECQNLGALRGGQRGRYRNAGARHKQHEFSDRFITYILARNLRVEEDLVDHLFNSSEKRLARTLLLLARYGKEEEPAQILPKVSQEMLAEMVGTTRSRVNFFMNRFKKLGFIEYNGGLKVHASLLSVVLHD